MVKQDSALRAGVYIPLASSAQAVYVPCWIVCWGLGHCHWQFAIYYRAASFPSQASYTVLAQESLTRPGFLQSLPAHQQYF